MNDVLESEKIEYGSLATIYVITHWTIILFGPLILNFGPLVMFLSWTILFIFRPLVPYLKEYQDYKLKV